MNIILRYGHRKLKSYLLWKDTKRTKTLIQYGSSVHSRFISSNINTGIFQQLKAFKLIKISLLVVMELKMSSPRTQILSLGPIMNSWIQFPSSRCVSLSNLISSSNLPSNLFPSGFPTIYACISCFPNTSHSSRSSCLCHTNNIRWTVQVQSSSFCNWLHNSVTSSSVVPVFQIYMK